MESERATLLLRIQTAIATLKNSSRFSSQFPGPVYSYTIGLESVDEKYLRKYLADFQSLIDQL
jgi:hypothetical protein